MGLNKFEQCNPSHKANFEYCCMKSNKVFCQSCWYRDSHPYKCYSTRCGHYEKLAHLVIDRTLEMKVMKLIGELSSSKNSYDRFYQEFFKIKEIITQIIKEDIENKLPLFIWSATIEMLNDKCKKTASTQEDEDTCSEMLKVIRRKNEKKSENLEAAVSGFEKVNHLHSAIKEKNSKKQYQCNFDNEIETIANFLNQESGPFIGNLKKSCKSHIEDEVKKLLHKFSPSIEFDGVKFSTKGGFAAGEGYKLESTCSALYTGMDSLKKYNGISVLPETLEKCPESTLEIAKCFLKERIKKIHQEINILKSSYPYKFAYPISTCLIPDPDYELSVIELEKASILREGDENPFLNSIHIVIMGPELILFQFKNHEENSVEIKIYGSNAEREPHVQAMIKKVLKQKRCEDNLKLKTIRYPFEQKLELNGLVYTYFEIAFEQLFMSREEVSEFEGEKYAQARGNKFFWEILHRWEAEHVIDYDIPVGVNQIIELFI